ncbi:MAG: M24 family metallopeptidase [bacterium]
MFNVSDLISLVTDKKACGILIKKPSNLFYITNFSGEGYAYITDKGEISLYADGRYSERASKESFEHIKIVKINEIYKDIARDILKKLSANGGIDGNSGRKDEKPASPPAIMFESDYITYDEYIAFNNEFANKIKLIPVSNAISKIRSLKDKSELDYILEAIYIAEKSMGDALRALMKSEFEDAAVCTEQDLALIYKKGLIEHYSKESFETIALSGKNSSLPHGMPLNTNIGRETVLLCDFGAERNGYKSDETITVHLGSPDGKFLDVYDTVYSAQQLAISKIKPGVKFNYLDKIARDYIEKKGYGKHFTHSLGHGVGLDIHEYPHISKKNGDTVKEGMVFTVEPGVYIEGEFGVRIEDMCYVEKDGARVITNIKKNKCKIEDLINGMD